MVFTRSRQALAVKVGSQASVNQAQVGGTLINNNVTGQSLTVKGNDNNILLMLLRVIL